MIHLSVPPDELNLDRTLSSGQVFRWKRSSDGSWQGWIKNSPVRVRHHNNLLSAEVIAGDLTEKDIYSFFRLDESLKDIQKSLSASEPALISLFERFTGLRLLRQSGVECLLSFVCAVVTSIPRIMWSIEELCIRYGDNLGHDIYNFPSLSTLSSTDPDDLRVGGMEFRCRSLSSAARELEKRGGEGWLDEIAGLAYIEAFSELTSLPHVGSKIADCALLFSLGFDEAFPLDTHTWRKMSQLYGWQEQARTDKAYRMRSAMLRQQFGPYAGWAQQFFYFDSISTKITKEI